MQAPVACLALPSKMQAFQADAVKQILSLDTWGDGCTVLFNQEL